MNDLGGQLLAVNEALVVSLMEAQERIRTGERLLDDMSRSIGPDALTQLPNRVAMLDRLAQALATARLHQHQLALLAVGVTNFADIVKTLGRDIGDRTIQAIANGIRDVLGTVETVSRHGSDVFLVLLPEVMLGEAELIVERIVEQCEALSNLHPDMPRLCANIGVVFFPDHGQSPLELISNAEIALNRAAQTGNSAVVSFDPGMAPAVDGSPSARGEPLSPGYPDEASFETAGSPLQRYLQSANEQLLLASMTSLNRQELAERALQRQTDFLAVLAHELRTPLTPIGIASAMMNEVEPDQIPRLQGIINRQIVHVSRLLTDLLEVSRIHTGKVRLKKEVVSIAQVIHQAMDTCAPAIGGRKQVLTMDPPKAHVRVRGDPVRLARVFTNLLDNASKYTPEGGAIGLRVAADERFVEVTITDSGIGIAQDALPHIFEPFMQERHAVAFDGTGLGIGLTVVRDMVEAHGGRVEASSGGNNQGTTFTVTLDRVNAPASRL